MFHAYVHTRVTAVAQPVQSSAWQHSRSARLSSVQPLLGRTVTFVYTRVHAAALSLHSVSLPPIPPNSAPSHPCIQRLNFSCSEIRVHSNDCCAPRRARRPTPPRRATPRPWPSSRPPPAAARGCCRPLCLPVAPAFRRDCHLPPLRSIVETVAVHPGPSIG